VHRPFHSRAGRKNGNKKAIRKLDPLHLLSVIPAIILRVLSLGLLVLLTGAIVHEFGVRIPVLPAIDATQLVYLCGAWWPCHR
jgi:hypothetical protein